MCSPSRETSETYMEVKEKVWRFNALCFPMESRGLLELNQKSLIKVIRLREPEREIGV